MNKFFAALLVFCCAQSVCAQPPKGYLLWSEERKLSADDFAIKTKAGATTPSFGQFTIDYEVNGFGFLTKNFNKKVRNYFIPDASWIDTTAALVKSLRYQQTLFDLAEVYTRQFRKGLRANRKQLLKGTEFAAALNKEIMAAFAKRRVDYDSDTNFGAHEEKQVAWEMQIQKELEDLREYAYKE